MSPIAGVVSGIVKDINDPQDLGRIQLTFPWMSESETVSYWARVAVPMAGKSRGFRFMPEVGDEVLVAFDHGDLRLPYVVGYLWNAVDTPPSNHSDFSVRRLKTVSGHIVEFDDSSGRERIYIKTQGGHEIEMKDSAPASVTIKTTGGQQIEMTDMPAGITVKTASGTSLQITDVPPGVSLTIPTGNLSISAPAGMVTLTCLQATVTATTVLNATAPAVNVTAAAILNVAAPMAIFAGVVQATTVLATSVVSSAYTPGVGNLL